MPRRLPYLCVTYIVFWKWNLIFTAAQGFDLIQRIKPNVKTSLSSEGTYNTPTTNWISSNAIDNKYTGDPNTCSCCSSSNGSEFPWWEIDLGGQYLIDSVTIIGRQDGSVTQQYSDLWIFVGDTSMQTKNGSLVYHGNPNNGNFTFSLHENFPRVFQYLIIKKFVQGVMTICEVKLTVDITLLPNLKTTAQSSQSSNFLENTHNYTSDKAIDGQDDYDIDHCGCCSVTNGSLPSWWQIDLKKKYLIGAIEVFGRKSGEIDQLQNALILGANSTINGVYLAGFNVTTVHLVSPTEQHFLKILDSATIYEYLSIVLERTVLTICEFRLFTKECKVGKFGNGCALNCHCSDRLQCDNVDGKCKTEGCFQGWTGSACDICSHGHFGENCDQTCHCNNDAECNRETGHCEAGCAPGWHGDSCNQDLNLILLLRNSVITNQSSLYKNASFNSSKAIDGVENYNVDSCECCSVTLGTAPSWWQIDLRNQYLIGAVEVFGRQTGSSGQLNNSIIIAGNTTLNDHLSIGINVSTIELSSDNDQHVYKTLDFAIIAQYFAVVLNEKTLTICEFRLFNHVCPIGTFGYGCFHQCHCSDRQTCVSVSGNCQTAGCIPGWQGISCNIACSHGRFGENCNQTCHCKNDGECNRETGHCEAGCAPGWHGDSCNQECKDGNFGDGCREFCFCMNDVPCNKTNGKCPNGCNMMWTGENCSKSLGIDFLSLQNVNTTQIGTYQTNYASKAIDGVKNYSVDSCGCCSVAMTSGTMAWWQIDLGQEYLIDAISLFGRSDGTSQLQLEGAGVYAGNESLSADGSSGSLVYTVPFNIGSKFHFDHQINSSIIARFFIVRIQNNTLTLCEFYLREKECSIGHFGIGCLHECHCQGQSQCDPATGHCQVEDCEPGWKGEACDTNCHWPTFGYRCNNTCHCTSCEPVNGTCSQPKCDPGWKGPSCSEECDKNKFGDDCNNTCHCFSCDHVDGTCNPETCDPGWQGRTCSQACDSGRFGLACNQTCHCVNRTECDNVNGTCFLNQCAPGWLGHACDQACDSGRFGLNCNQSCHCVDKTECDNANGTCFLKQCDPGWLGDACDKGCGHGHFGINCSSMCHCINDTECYHISGLCYKSECAPGWTENNCSVACKTDSFGKNCSRFCHCSEDSCDPINGTCIKLQLGCKPGYQGYACETFVEQRTGQDTSVALAGGTSGAIIVVAIAVVVGFFMYRRHKSRSSNQDSAKAFSHLDEALRQKQQRRAESHSSRRVAGNDNSAYIETNVDDKTHDKEQTCTEDAGGGYYDFAEVVGIRIHELWDYIHEKTKNECEQLFGEFKKLPSGLVHPCTIAEQLVNRGKNRYREMYAYDHTRVVLEEKNDKGTDYVNATYIDGYNMTRKFVACQGPTKQMLEDFWRMVWQLKSDKIVMLTNLVEMGATKCVLYWPEDEEFSYGKVNVKIVKVDTDLDFDIRHLNVWKEGESPRRIRQYHFKSWPDKDVPDSTWCLVKFWRAVQTDAKSKAGPVIVHCSAGVGRTGTFIALDNLIHQARDEGCVRPFQIVQSLRGQRVNMVQTKEQYVYLHEVLADALCFGTHFVWSTQFEPMYMSLLQKEDGEEKTRLEVQYDLIQKSLKNTESKEAEAAEYSNMEMILSESDAYRPKLKKRGSKFVQQLGATLIPNYDERNTFLVAMSPDKSTIEEFWSLVDDLNIKTVIMLTEKSSTCYKASCDLGSHNDNGTKFHVNKVEENIRKGHTERSFTFKESHREEEDHLATVKQFEYTAWKDGYFVPGDARSLVDFLEAIFKWQSHFSESQPVLIHDSDGCTRSGILCVALNEVQRIKTEGGHINIVQSVKMMKQRKPKLIHSFEQYKFCYELILAYLKHTEVYQNLK